MRNSADDSMDPNEWMAQEILINRRACEEAIHQHRYLKARHDQDFQRLMVKWEGFGRKDKVNLAAALLEGFQYWYWGVHYRVKWVLKQSRLRG